MTAVQEPTPAIQFATAWWQVFGAAPTSVPIILASEPAAPVREAAQRLAPRCISDDVTDTEVYTSVNGKKLGRWLARAADEPRTLYDLDGTPYRLTRVRVVANSTAFLTTLWRMVPEREFVAQEAA